ncbi:MAG TPA: glycosyltransferase [Thermoleophilaceae bacterium]|nr:glycosyltransferase [Thermoleophilaceae bacterium]
MPTLLAASAGGHLDELIRLRPRLGPLGDDVVWVTFETPQSRSRLADENVVFLPLIAPRDYQALARSLPRARKLLSEIAPEAVVSTGSAIALSLIPLARARGIPCHYVESAARSDGPSLTGRLLAKVHGVHLYTQYADWTGKGWHYAGSVFDGFAPGPRLELADVSRVVVTLGMIKPYGFESLVEKLLTLLPPTAEVLWQTGSTDVSRYPIEAHPTLPARELDAAMREADLVIAHSGIGSSLAAIEAGHAPLLVPRRGHRGEHVDDHQQLIAADLAERGLAIAREVDELTFDDVAYAAQARVQRVEASPPLMLAVA